MFPTPILLSILKNETINFSTFEEAHVEQALTYLIQRSQKAIDDTIDICTSSAEYFQDNTVQQLLFAMDDADDKVSRLWSYISHINSVNNSERVRDLYERCLQKITDYSISVSQNRSLYDLYVKIRNEKDLSSELTGLKKTIDNAIQGFELSGINLPQETQDVLADITKSISEIKTKISQNVLDCQDSFTYFTDDVSELKGLPQTFISNAEIVAREQNREGYTLTLNQPVVNAVLTFCEKRELRELFYKMNSTVASDQGTFASELDNTPLIKQLLDLKKQKCEILGFESMATASLVKKMAQTPEHVISFLTDISNRVRQSAERDFQEIKDFALRIDGVSDVQPWDVSFYSEKLRQEKFSFSEEEIREYFPLDTVLNGLFSLVQRLYDVSIDHTTADVWNEDVMCYNVSRGDERIATFYMDLFSRKGKRSGAWMADYHNRWKSIDGKVHLPVTFLTCNFNKSTTESIPTLLSHDEVITLFHEFGHGLHHMLTQVNVAGVSGINGVQWDAVELPSQFMENWCWVPEIISQMSRHYLTHNALPSDTLKNMVDAKNFQSGLFLTRQVLMGLFDMKLHHQYTPSTVVHDVIQELYETVAIIKPAEYNRFECAFMHIFGGGYSAGYYSYLWAEVLSSDAFARFEEEGLDNKQVSKDFEQAILANGGLEDAGELFRRFRGRDPSAEGFLRHYGIQQ